ncbi:MAG TPA: bifunctional histidinol-phosphatase/imidazoleglycerol-phosphate dehydratase HisB [Gammaproteobacteria bacterium]|nr:bifunctional histidinol-phosphatase/imidazoleglycerol-phosphate dehydratase HisB [Gammaproteobacteria bacterium]
MRRILFLDRDGTLIEEPDDEQIDSIEKVRLVPGVIPALLRIQSAGYELVIVSNQDGLGTASFPQQAFDQADRHIRALFASQGIHFAAVFICPHTAAQGCACRKPAVGLVRDFLAAEAIDRQHSGVVGDRDSDLELARNLGLAGWRIGRNGQGGPTWSDVAHGIVDEPRVAVVRRRTRETDIRVEVDLDSEAEPQASTGIGFFDHMLEQLGKHAGFKLRVQCTGDLNIDEHHTVEDVALTLGQALREALGDKHGIQRYGFLLPMDEADAEVSLDLGGRPFLVFEAAFARDRVGGLPTELVSHFFRSLAEALGAAIHIRVRGENTHHMVEVCFKGVARALRQAIVRRGDQLPSTKGQL